MFHGRMTEKALGGGNCAFNAFILGLAEKDVLDGIETNLNQQKKDPDVVLKDFIKIAGQALLGSQNTNWNLIKNELIRLKKSDKEHLQKSLHYHLRLLAISKLNREKHFEDTLPRVQGELDNYILKYLKYGEVVNIAEIGDIFIRHGFIERYFQFLCYAYPNNTEKAKQDFNRWWKEVGHDTFISAMTVEGEWAGDLEIASLAEYFHVNVEMMRQHNPNNYKIHFNYGVLEVKEIKQETVNQLITRGVIDKTPTQSGQYRFAKHFTEDELKSLLTEVPEWKTVERYYVSSHCDINGTQLLHDLSIEALVALASRDIITMNSRGQYVFSVTNTVAKHRAEEIKIHKDIIDSWRANHLNLPTIVLRNDVGMHWDNTCSIFAERKFHSFFEETQPGLPKKNEANEAKLFDTCEKRNAYVQKLFSKPVNKNKDVKFNELLAVEERKSNNRIMKISAEKLQAQVKNGKLIVYTKDDKTTLYVSRTSLMKLDNALTWKMQKELMEEKDKAELVKSLLL